MKLIAADDISRRLTINGRQIKLPNKCWQVVKLLMANRTQIVSRQQLIEQVWGGNVFSGEKALTQTIWLLRDALQDDPASPSFIQTHPGQGYQWVAPAPSSRVHRTAGQSAALWNPQFGGVALAMIMLLVSIAAWDGSAVVDAAGFQSASRSIAPDGTYAYQKNGRIVVELDDGRRAILVPSGDKSFSNPALSADGEFLAVHVNEAGRCNLLVVEFETRNKQEFTGCLRQPARLSL